MRNKKKMIAIGGAALALIVAAAVTVSLVHRSSGKSLTIDASGSKNDEYSTGVTHATEITPEVEIEKYDEAYVIDSEDVQNRDVLDARIEEEMKAKREGVIFGEEDDTQRIASHTLAAPGSADPDSVDTGTDDGEEVEGEADLSVGVYRSQGYSDNEVLCEAESEEEAESIAAQISGTLLSWEHGVAAIKIDESVDSLLEKLEQQGSSLQLYRKYYH